jgi:hypothetical protein
MKKQHLRMLMEDAARAVLIARSNDPGVRREIAVLLGSLDGKLSNEQVLEKLKALRAGASPSARSLQMIRPNKNPEAGKLKQRLRSLFKMRSSSENGNFGT